MSIWFLDVSGLTPRCWRKSLSLYATISLPTSLTISGIPWLANVICSKMQSDSWQIAQRCFAPPCRATWSFSLPLPYTKPLNSMFHNMLNFLKIRLCYVTERAKLCPVKTTVARASWNVIATEYQIRSGDQLLSWRIATLSGRTITITQTWNSGQYCYSTDGKTLICDKDLSWSIQQIFEWNTLNQRFKRKIINIFTGTIMTGTNNMLCVKSGDILNCNTDPNSLWDPIKWENENDVPTTAQMVDR